MGLLKKGISFILNPTHSRTAAILILFLLALAVPLTVFIAQKQQETRQRAEGNEDAYNSCVTACYDPNNQELDPDNCAEQCKTLLGISCNGSFYPDSYIKSTFLCGAECVTKDGLLGLYGKTCQETATPVPVNPTPDCSQPGCTCEQTCRSAPGDPANCLSICASQGLAPTEFLLPSLTPIPTSPTPPIVVTKVEKRE